MIRRRTRGAILSRPDRADDPGPSVRSVAARSPRGFDTVVTRALAHRRGAVRVSAGTDPPTEEWRWW